MLLCVDADWKPLERDEHCSIAQSGGCDDHCRQFFFPPLASWIFDDVLWVRACTVVLLCDRNLARPETKGKTLEEIENAF